MQWPATVRFDPAYRTPRGPLGPWMAPGQYRVVLTVDGKQYSEPLTVQPNPYGWHPLAQCPHNC